MNIEICNCSGGMAEGFRRAGITFDLVVDKDPHAVESYERNHGHRPVQMDVFDLLRMLRAGWRPTRHDGNCGWSVVKGAVDLFVADPPCTPWSRAGKRMGLEDERDCLEATAELIRLLRPRAYLIGNVPGLQDSTSWHVVQEVIGGLAKDGYCVSDYASLDAADYGVPQHRVRPFWFGHLDGPCVRWPAPTHGAPTQQIAIGGAALLPWVTCREALQHIPLAELGRPVRMRLRERGHPPSTPDAPARAILADGGRAGKRSSTLLIRDPNDTRKANLSTPDEPAFTLTRNTHSEGATILAQKPLAWPWDRPATTILGDERLSVPGHHDAKTGNASHKGPNAVVLSARAAAILQGFPDGECDGGGDMGCADVDVRPGERCEACGFTRRWHFTGATKKAVWSQLGQAMPPGLAEAVARAIAEQMAAARTSQEKVA